MTRGMMEITAWVTFPWEHGLKPSGLSGYGDLIVTCE